MIVWILTDLGRQFLKPAFQFTLELTINSLHIKWLIVRVRKPDYVQYGIASWLHLELVRDRGVKDMAYRPDLTHRVQSSNLRCCPWILVDQHTAGLASWAVPGIHGHMQPPPQPVQNPHCMLPHPAPHLVQLLDWLVTFIRPAGPDAFDIPGVWKRW